MVVNTCFGGQLPDEPPGPRNRLMEAILGIGIGLVLYALITGVLT